mmetsp:Transcript_17473/g.23017  ORF Transcript_17473/g.23017 Transcript_17473/m.23017 type:complete len:120 (-) Transcript_17473:83-442(-)
MHTTVGNSWSFMNIAQPCREQFGVLTALISGVSNLERFWQPKSESSSKLLEQMKVLHWLISILQQQGCLPLTLLINRFLLDYCLFVSGSLLIFWHCECEVACRCGIAWCGNRRINVNIV